MSATINQTKSAHQLNNETEALSYVKGNNQLVRGCVGVFGIAAAIGGVALASAYGVKSSSTESIAGLVGGVAMTIIGSVFTCFGCWKTTRKIDQVNEKLKPIQNELKRRAIVQMRVPVENQGNSAKDNMNQKIRSAEKAHQVILEMRPGT